MKTVLIHAALLAEKTVYAVSQRTGCYGDDSERAIVTINPDGTQISWQKKSTGGSFSFFLTSHADMSAQVSRQFYQWFVVHTTDCLSSRLRLS